MSKEPLVRLIVGHLPNDILVISGLSKISKEL